MQKSRDMACPLTFSNDILQMCSFLQGALSSLSTFIIIYMANDGGEWEEAGVQLTNKWLRRILCIFWRDKITNKAIWERTGQEDMGIIIRRRRLRLLGH